MNVVIDLIERKKNNERESRRVQGQRVNHFVCYKINNVLLCLCVCMTFVSLTHLLSIINLYDFMQS